MINATKEEKIQCLDCLRDPTVTSIFFRHFEELRQGYLEQLVETGEDSFRYKVQMIDEVLEFKDDLYKDWKSEN